jgi:rRNA maturation endonuclease Nob1
MKNTVDVVKHYIGKDNLALKTSYSDSRVLDAIASLYNVFGTCSAVAKVDGALYISQNKKPTLESVTYISSINHLLKSSDTNSLFLLYIIKNQDFISYFKSIKRSIKQSNDSDLIHAYSEVKNKRSSLDKLIRELIKTSDDLSKLSDFEDGNQLIELYFNFLKQVKSSHNNNLTKYDKEFLLRPIQDVCKIIQTKICDQITDVYTVYNTSTDKSLTVHAEINLLHFLDNKFNLDNQIYIGVSKLTCGNCYRIFEDKKNEKLISCGGTHAVIDNKWGIDNRWKNNKLEISYHKFDKNELQEKQPYPQTRKLSIDSIEELICIDSLARQGQLIPLFEEEYYNDFKEDFLS